MSATKRWSYKAGERGRNRVRAYEDSKSGKIMLEFYEDGKRRAYSTGHADRDRAKQEADEVAVGLGNQESPIPPEETTIRQLFDIYGSEVTPQKSERDQRYEESASKMLVAFFGPERKARTLDRRLWDSFVRERSEGRVSPGAKEKRAKVRGRTVGRDLKFLSAVLTWGTMARDERGGFLLDRNPCRGFPFPPENPRRPVVDQDRYRAMLGGAATVGWRMRLALVLAHETGHRIGAIRLLRWSDVDLSKMRIRWRAESDKLAREHVTPLTGEAVQALEESRRHNPAIGDAWVLPSPSNPTVPCSRRLVCDWWHRAEKAGKLKHIPHLGWHGLRRKFGEELKGVPLKDLCALGGWSDPQTVLRCYQRADEATMRGALDARRVANRE